jgi:hypothetical protein
MINGARLFNSNPKPTVVSDLISASNGRKSLILAFQHRFFSVAAWRETRSQEPPRSLKDEVDEEEQEQQVPKMKLPASPRAAAMP